MTNYQKQSVAARFKTLLEDTLSLTRSRVANTKLGSGPTLLAEFQCDRLRATYADFATSRRYAKALEFFLTDLYGPIDFSQRDADIQRVYPLMVRVLSADAIESLTYGLELNQLSMALDAKLLDVLMTDYALDPINEPKALDFTLYADAYRACDNYKDRVKQINLIRKVGLSLEEVTKKRMIMAAVKLARQPAKVAGFSELQSFIERGLAAFRTMGAADKFLNAIHDRESRLLESIYDESPVPKDIQVN